MSRCSPARARTASWPACCSRAPYHEARGEDRRKVLTPDTAHGTNPATVTMAGCTVVKVGTNADGGVDVDDLRAKADGDVACLMLTNPNTLGLFDPNIEQIGRIVHGVGATLYYDGANLNAVMGRSRPGDMGFDIVHFNLHKTFTQPHGGGGPGSGPIAVSDRIAPYLMHPRIVRGPGTDGEAGGRGRFDLVDEGETSIGRLRGFQGNYGTFVSAYAYIRTLGADGLQDASETAVLNANYLLGPAEGAGGRRACRWPSASAACTSSSSSGAPDEARARHPDARPGQAACSTTASTRRRSTSRCSSTRRCSSSPPRRRRRRRSTPSPRRSPRSCARRARTPRLARNAPLHDAGAAAWTRRPRPSGRSSASRSSGRSARARGRRGRAGRRPRGGRRRP
jgi:hypothetical protein